MSAPAGHGRTTGVARTRADRNRRGLAAAAVLLLAMALSTHGLSAVVQDGGTDRLARSAAIPGQDLPVREHVLENGMRFLLLPREGAPIVSFVWHVPVGSVNESLGTTGITHFLEHLFFKGTTTIGTRDVEAELRLFDRIDATHDSLITARGALPRPDEDEVQRLEARVLALEDSARAYVIPNEYDRILSREGARGMNATTSYEETQYFVELPANRTQLWFVLEADRMRNPVFREFFTEREVIAEERRTRIENSPGGTLYEEHMAAAFRVHPYGVSPTGHMDDIYRLTRPDVEAYHQLHYGPGNTTVAIVGDFEPDSAAAWADRYFGPIPPRASPPPVLVREPEQRGERRIAVHHDAEPQLRVGWKIPSGYHPDAPALRMLSNLLTGGPDARLHRRIVREERLASNVSAGRQPGSRYPGLFTIQALPRSPHSPEDVEEAIYEVLGELMANPPSEEELDRVRIRLEAAEVRRLTSNRGLAFQLVESQAMWGDWQETFLTQQRMRDVQPGEIVAVIERYFTPDRRTVGILRRGEGATP